MKDNLTKLKEETTEGLQPGTVVLIDTLNKKYITENSNGFFAITALEDTTLDASLSVWNMQHRDSTGTSGDVKLTINVVIPKGLTVYINASILVITAGKCLAYARRNTRSKATV
jgi:hypothetical protein